MGKICKHADLILSTYQNLCRVTHCLTDLQSLIWLHFKKLDNYADIDNIEGSMSKWEGSEIHRIQLTTAAPKLKAVCFSKMRCCCQGCKPFRVLTIPFTLFSVKGCNLAVFFRKYSGGSSLVEPRREIGFSNLLAGGCESAWGTAGVGGPEFGDAWSVMLSGMISIDVRVTPV